MKKLNTFCFTLMRSENAQISNCNFRVIFTKHKRFFATSISLNTIFKQKNTFVRNKLKDKLA